MRPVLPSDLDNCVWALLMVPPDLRPSVMEGILAEADLADRYRKRTGKPHARFGDGSLAAVARKKPQAPSGGVCAPDYCFALSVVIEELGRWRTHSDQSER